MCAVQMVGPRMRAAQQALTAQDGLAVVLGAHVAVHAVKHEPARIGNFCRSEFRRFGGQRHHAPSNTQVQRFLAHRIAVQQALFAIDLVLQPLRRIEIVRNRFAL